MPGACFWVLDWAGAYSSYSSSPFKVWLHYPKESVHQQQVFRPKRLAILQLLVEGQANVEIPTTLS